MNEKRNRAAQYLRSSAHDEEGAASLLEAQERYCLEYADEAGFEIDAEHVYREVGSGSGLDRPALQGLLQAAEDGRIEAVIVYNMSRLSGDRSELRSLVRKLNQAGVVVLNAHLRRNETRGGK